MGSADEHNCGEYNDRLSGLLAVERAVMLTATRMLERLSRVDCTGFSREQIADHTVAMVTAAERVRTVSARFMAVSETQASALTKGARSMTALVNTSCGVTRRQGTTMDLIGSAPDRYGLFYQALLEGRVGSGHIEVLHPVWRQVDRDQFNSAERALVDLAELCTPEEFADYLARWRAHADEDAALGEYIANQAAQHFQYGFDLFGNVHYAGTVGPEHAEPFVETIETEAPKHRTELNKPSQALGDAVVELVLNPDGKYRAHLEILKSEDSEALTFETRDSAADRVRDPTDLGFSTIHWPCTSRGTLHPTRRRQPDPSRRGPGQSPHVDRDGNIIDDRAGGRHFGVIQKRMIRLRDNRCRHRRLPKNRTHLRIRPHRSATITAVAPSSPTDNSSAVSTIAGSIETTRWVPASSTIHQFSSSRSADGFRHRKRRSHQQTRRSALPAGSFRCTGTSSATNQGQVLLWACLTRVRAMTLRVRVSSAPSKMLSTRASRKCRLTSYSSA